MQRIDSRPAESSATSQDYTAPQPAQEQNQSPPASKQWNIPTGFASTGSQAHTQSFEEIYGVPENFLEIEVSTLLGYSCGKHDYKETAVKEQL